MDDKITVYQKTAYTKCWQTLGLLRVVDDEFHPVLSPRGFVLDTPGLGAEFSETPAAGAS